MELLYGSTRGGETGVTASQAVLKGLADDGGLYVPERIPTLDVTMDELAGMTYQETAYAVMKQFLTDYTEEELKYCISHAYDEKFDTEEIAPLAKADGMYFLELFHGKTIAFKDMALSILPYLMTTAAKKNHAKNEIVILTATSGDTGKAAMAGFADVPGTRIIVFYPKNGVSRVQELQMLTQKGANTSVVGIEGNFDDAQTGVKKIFGDKEFAKELDAMGFQLSSANSINIGRLAPQVVYYFRAYADLVRRGTVAVGERVDYVVPTGNFGDILAGYYAKRLGLPVARLIVASDANNVLFDFLTTGTYDRKRPFFTTTSPSMDILVSSNLERMLYYLSDGDAELVSRLMGQLADEGSYTLPDELLSKIQEVFACGWADEDEVARAIKACWDENGYLIDPHTACGYHVLSHMPAVPGSKARILLSTANPYKFPRAVAGALGLFCPPDDFACMQVLEKATGTCAPTQLAELQDKPVLHTDVVDIDGMASFVEQAAGGLK